MKELSDYSDLTALAVDTATEACSASLLKGGQVIARYEVAPQQHNVLIFTMCRDILAEGECDFASLDALVFGRGPGAFTGVRIAASFAQAIAYAQKVPLVAVSDLQVVAQAVADQHSADRVCVAMDARMQEVYSACYQRDEAGILQAVTEEMVCAPGDIVVPDDFVCVGAGTGWQCAGSTLSDKLGARMHLCEPEALPDATTMLKIAAPLIEAKAFTPADEAFPQYLRNPLAK